VHTEDSHKYTIEGFRGLAARAGFTVGKVWCDAEHLFALYWLKSR
jgi:L-histidine N-alpha-methyltransferase